MRARIGDAGGEVGVNLGEPISLKVEGGSYEGWRWKGLRVCVRETGEAGHVSKNSLHWRKKLTHPMAQARGDERQDGVIGSQQN